MPNVPIPQNGQTTDPVIQAETTGVPLGVVLPRAQVHVVGANGNAVAPGNGHVATIVMQPQVQQAPPPPAAGAAIPGPSAVRSSKSA